MKSLPATLRRSFMALAVRSSQRNTFVQSFSALQHTPSRCSARWMTSADIPFEPASPPGTHGTPVFPDITYSKNGSEEALMRSSDSEAVFVVTGASRGIGFQFVKTLYDRTQGRIVACCRSPDQAEPLREFCDSVDQPGRIHVVPLDLEDQATIENAGKIVKDDLGRVDMLLNVAGLLGDAKTTPGPERSIAKMDRKWLETTMAINTIGPIMLTQELAPLMMQRRGKDQVKRPVAVVANLSARVGSISDNGLGGWYSYRMSKSALNQFTRTLALEMKRHKVWSIALHPGTTETGLSKPFQGNVKEGSLFPVEFTVQKLVDILDNMGEQNSGGLYDWSGQALSF